MKRPIFKRHIAKALVWLSVATSFGALALAQGTTAAGRQAQDAPLRFADQGAGWTPELRAAYYVQDQGSQLIPLAWFKALKQADGQPFAEGALARYGYLPNPSAANPEGLPLGFSLAKSQQGPEAGTAIVGMTCAACHTRQISVDGRSYRIDGGPAFADFQSFVTDLDAAVRRALANDAAYQTFATGVLGLDAAQPDAVAALRESVALWSLRFHTLISRSLPADRAWGPARLDAIAMIYNRLNGLDLGPAPTYMLPDNMATGDAPARYPFLWNAGRQDKTQWGGWAANGNAGLAIARNLGQAIGVFAYFQPRPKTSSTPLDHDYLSANSANVAGLAMAEGLLARLGPPVWPFPVDQALAERGRAIFNRSAAAGGCVDCHGIAEGEPRPPSPHTWKTPTLDVGTDARQWQVVSRMARSGSLEGASVPGVVGPLQATDLSLNMLKAVVTGTLVEIQAAQGKPPAAAEAMGAVAPAAVSAMTHEDMKDSMQVPEMRASETRASAGQATQAQAPAGAFVYEARVLQGIWAAAPYLHNGSVPSLAELLKPAAQRIKQFKVGPAYDIKTVGLAAEQDSTFTLATTGCADRASGNSNCGHDYGTRLPADEKAALLEYLKTL